MDDASTHIAVGFGIAELWFFAIVFAVGSASGFFRTTRDRDFIGIGNLCSIAICSGFLGFAIVALLCCNAGAFVGSEPLYLGIAALIGLLGKDADPLIQLAIKSTLRKFGIYAQVKSADQPLEDE